VRDITIASNAVISPSHIPHPLIAPGGVDMASTASKLAWNAGYGQLPFDLFILVDLGALQ
jgi:hypothetical protein